MICLRKQYVKTISHESCDEVDEIGIRTIVNEIIDKWKSSVPDGVLFIIDFDVFFPTLLHICCFIKTENVGRIGHEIYLLNKCLGLHYLTSFKGTVKRRINFFRILFVIMIIFL